MNDRKSSANTTKQILISLAVALLLLFFINYQFILNPDMSAKPIKLAIGEWAPYTGEYLIEKGIVTAIVTKVFKDMGYAPEYHFMSWPMAESIAGTGEKDTDIQGTFPYIESDQRMDLFYISDTLITLENAFFFHAQKNPGGQELNQIQDLENHRILSMEGYAHPDTLAGYYDTLHLFPNNSSAFRELSIRNDHVLVMEAREVGEQLLEEKLPDLARFIRRAPLTWNSHLRLMLSKNNPNNLSLIDEFNEKLKEFKSNPDAYYGLINSVKNKINLQRAVVLQPYLENGLIYCYRDRDVNTSVLLPKGTKAIIKEWDASFLHFQHAKNMGDQKTFVKVKLLNGPLSSRDSLYYVDGRSIQISNN
jgi:polar amino acid transport system substrate-binding protein